MKCTWKETILRVIILLIGLVIAHFGVTLFLLVNLGTDPFNVLVQGIFRAMNQYLNWSFLTHGRVHIVISCLIIIILLYHISYHLSRTFLTFFETDLHSRSGSLYCDS